MSEYIHQEYPKWKHHWTGKTVIVNSSDQEAALQGGWANTPEAFAQYQGPRAAPAIPQDPVKWVADWPVPHLSSDHRKKIRTTLLRADGTFWRSPDTTPSVVDCMRLAFNGIAKVLFDAGLLTERLLEEQLPQLVWDSAIAGGWWRFASETPQDIFPERLGHYWVWRDDSRDWKRLFRSENGEWLAQLQEAPATGAATATPNPVKTGSAGGDPAWDDGSSQIPNRDARLTLPEAGPTGWPAAVPVPADHSRLFARPEDSERPSQSDAASPSLGEQLDVAADNERISHEEQAARIGIGRTTYFNVKVGGGGKKARRLAEAYLCNLGVRKTRTD